MWGEVVAAVIRVLVAPFIFMWTGVNWARRRAAESALKRDKKADARDEDIRGLPDADLDKRLRDSME